MYSLERFASLAGYACVATLCASPCVFAQTGLVFFGWGENGRNQLAAPTPPTGLWYTSLTNGWDKGYALRTDGQIIGWGSAPQPPALPSGTTYTAVSSRNGINFGLRSDGLIEAWGFAYEPAELQVPALPPGMTYTAIAAGGLCFSAALRSDGRIVAWGAIPETFDSAVVLTPPAGTTVTSLSVGQEHLVALVSDFSTMSIGLGLYGECALPVFPAGEHAVKVSCGTAYTVYLGSEGTVVTTGINNFGQQNVPVPAVGTRYTDISAGHEHCIAIKSDGTAVAWGRNLQGESTIPTAPGGRTFASVSAGIGFSLALLNEITDANHNGIRDDMDIATGTSLDCNADTIPDECQHLNHPATTGSTSLSFDGNYQYVEIPYSYANNPESFTAEMWVKYDGALGEGNYQSPLTNRYSCCDFYDLRGFTFYKTPDDIWMFMTGAGDGGSWSVLTSPQVVPGQWTHLAASYDHDTDLTVLYVDGGQVASATGFHYAPNDYFPMRIGAGTTEDPWANYPFHGQIDDVRIWDHARSAVEIAVAMNEHLSGNEPGLNSLYQLDDATGELVTDSAAAGGLDTGFINSPTWTMPTPCGAGCPADFDGDGTVDFFDYDAFVTCFEGTFCPDGKTSDFDSDGSSDFFDYDAFVVAFETPC